jgi:hypothetical protein
MLQAKVVIGVTRSRVVGLGSRLWSQTACYVVGWLST